MRVLAAVVALVISAPVAHAERRQLGIQLGGSGFFEAVARFRVHGDVSIEVGGMAITHAVNLSLGVEVEPAHRGRLAVYASSGVATAGAFGPVLVDPACTGDDCAVRAAGSLLLFGYARAGLRWRFRDGTRAVSAEVGGWLGTWDDDSGARRSHGWFAAPVAGVSYLWLR